MTDYLSQCRGQHSRRVGPHHLERICLVDPATACSARYEWGLGQKLYKQSLYCGLVKNPSTIRERLYSGPGFWDEAKEMVLLEKAKELLEKHGPENHVLELSQPHVMGGITYTLSGFSALDKKYIGYRGYMTYKRVCKKIKEIKNKKNE